MKLDPIHPGQVLKAEWIDEGGWVPFVLAAAADIHPRELLELIDGTRRLTPEMATGLAAVLGTSREFWLNLQALYDKDVTDDSR